MNSASHEETRPMNGSSIPQYATTETIGTAKDSIGNETGNQSDQPILPPMATGHVPIDLTIEPTLYEVDDTAEYATFRLYINNPGDSLVMIDQVDPSCGCIMTTVQKSYARKDKPAEIYVAIKTSMMNDIQPYTVDVKMSVPTPKPLRLQIQKKRK